MREVKIGERWCRNQNPARVFEVTDVDADEVIGIERTPGSYPSGASLDRNRFLERYRLVE